MDNSTIQVEVVYALRDQQPVLKVVLKQGSTVQDAIQCAGLDGSSHLPVGIFGKACSLSQAVKDGDRVEIYRPLVIDPKEARRSKAKKLNAVR